jgi:hypothetical protein
VRRYFRVLLVAAMSTVLGTTFVPPPASAATTYFEVINKHSGLCMTMFTDGAAQWPCAFSDPWEFFFQGGGRYSIINYRSGKCLTIKNGSIDVNARVVEGACTSSIANLWRKVQVSPGNYHIVNENSGMCLTVSGASLEEGQKLIQYPCNTSAPHNETWITFPVNLG